MAAEGVNNIFRYVYTGAIFKPIPQEATHITVIAQRVHAGAFCGHANIEEVECQDVAGNKARNIMGWIVSVLHKINHYQAKHQRILNEASTIILDETAASLRPVLSGFVMEYILSFLELQSFDFEEEEGFYEEDSNEDEEMDQDDVEDVGDSIYNNE